MYALPDAGSDMGRGGLCKLLATLVARGEQVRVIFDGPPPARGLGRQIDETGVAVEYSAGRSADEIILEHIAANSAPRRLTVVSSDRVIRKAAARRRCRVEISEDFARVLLRLVEDQRRRQSRPPAEPKEKRNGLNEAQTRQWLEEFGFDE